MSKPKETHRQGDLLSGLRVEATLARSKERRTKGAGSWSTIGVDGSVGSSQSRSKAGKATERSTDWMQRLRGLDDAAFERLLKAVSAEARRRGRAMAEVPTIPTPASKDRRAVKRRPKGRTAADVAPGVRRIVRAALSEGVKPGTIARQLGLSRHQVMCIGRETDTKLIREC